MQYCCWVLRFIVTRVHEETDARRTRNQCLRAFNLMSFFDIQRNECAWRPTKSANRFASTDWFLMKYSQALSLKQSLSTLKVPVFCICVYANKLICMLISSIIGVSFHSQWCPWKMRIKLHEWGESSSWNKIFKYQSVNKLIHCINANEYQSITL